MSEGQTVLVTGGSGYIGGWTIVALLKQGYTVRTTIRNLARADEVRANIANQVDPGPRLAFFAADLMSDKGWDEAAAGCDYVLHIASPLGVGVKDAQSLIRPAREGALRALAAAKKAGARRVVMTSSVAAASPPTPRQAPPTRTRPSGPTRTARTSAPIPNPRPWPSGPPGSSWRAKAAT